MSKAMETKQAILDKLKEKKKTVTELSEELKLTKGAISQHLSKLVEMGAVTSYIDPHFRSIKYFEISQGYQSGTLRTRQINNYIRIGSMLVVLVLILAFASTVYFKFQIIQLQIGFAAAGESSGPVETIGPMMCSDLGGIRAIVGILGLGSLLIGVFLKISVYLFSILKKNNKPGSKTRLLQQMAFVLIVGGILGITAAIFVSQIISLLGVPLPTNTCIIVS